MKLQAGHDLLHEILAFCLKSGGNALSENLLDFRGQLRVVIEHEVVQVHDLGLKLCNPAECVLEFTRLRLNPKLASDCVPPSETLLG